MRVQLVGGASVVVANAILAEQEHEVVLNDWLVEGLRIHLVAVGRGLYRVGPRGRLRRSEKAEKW